MCTVLEEELKKAKVIYVLSADGKPLMPTRRLGHIKRLLNKGKAKITSHVPFTVQLKYESGYNTQRLFDGTDPGRTNIGNAVINENSDVVYRDHVTTRNKDVPKLMAERKRHRQASRHGERQVRKRQAKKNGTQMQTEGHQKKRHLPGYENGAVTVKGITNTEAKFNNRLKDDDWITPTVRQLVQTHISSIRQKCAIMPITDVCIELNKFSFMKMDDGTCFGLDFQNGRMKGYKSVNDYVYSRQNGTCACCGRPIEEYHHIVPRHHYGSDLPENIVGLCSHHHEQVHLGNLHLDTKGIRKTYGALSVLNQAIPYIYEELVKMFGKEHVHLVSGWETKRYYESHNLGKDHDTDAVCIACIGAGIELSGKSMPPCHEIKQFRRHDRQIVRKQSERTYYLPKDPKHPVCKNRHKRFEQKRDSLEEFRVAHPCDVGRLKVKKSKRSHNRLNRILPGAVFLYRGNRYILSGTKNLGTRYMYAGCRASGISAKQCTVLYKNRGLVYVN